MKKIYLDRTENNKCVSIFINGTEVINAGTTIYFMQQSDNNEVYQRFADSYDIHFIFNDNVPQIDFYTVPQFDIFAMDSDGGYIGTIGNQFDQNNEYMIGYLDKDKNCFIIAPSAKDFLANAETWKENKKPYDSIQIFRNIEEAKKALEFVDVF